MEIGMKITRNQKFDGTNGATASFYGIEDNPVPSNLQYFTNWNGLAMVGAFQIGLKLTHGN